MIERRSGPARRIMAIITRVRALDMICRLALRRRIVVAAGTRPVHHRVVHLHHRAPRVRAVTVFAGVARINVPGILSRRRGTVMTIEA